MWEGGTVVQAEDTWRMMLNTKINLAKRNRAVQARNRTVRPCVLGVISSVPQ